MGKAVEAVIWDLDNTLYRFTDQQKYQCNEAAAKAAQANGLDLPYDELLKIAIASEEEYSYSLHHYTLYHDLAYRDLHHPFHDAIEVENIQPVKGVRETVEEIDLPKVILTNATRQWTHRVLKYCDLDDLFHDHEILAMEDFEYEPKARGTRGLDRAIDTLNKPIENIVIVDDLERNLKLPKQKGLKTVLVHGQSNAAHIDYQFDCITKINIANLL